MPYNGLSASKIARIVGCHPNTVRMYEEWGLLPPVPRNSKGYRLYTQFHLDQMKLARMAFNTPFPGSKIRKSTYSIVKTAASGDLGGALSIAYAHLALVRSEMIQGTSLEVRITNLVQFLNTMGYNARWEARPRYPQVEFKQCPYSVVSTGQNDYCQIDQALLEISTSYKTSKVKHAPCLFQIHLELPV